MQVYFACSITGGRQDEPVYQAIVDYLLASGYRVPTAILAQPEVLDLESAADPEQVFTRDIGWIDGSRALVAEVSTPSHGVGYEIAYALGLPRPVLCCYRADRTISKMILGNTHPWLQVGSYRTPGEAVALVAGFLDDLK